MNDPKDMPIDIEEMRAWLNSHYNGGARGSWKVLEAESGKRTDLPPCWKSPVPAR